MCLRTVLGSGIRMCLGYLCLYGAWKTFYIYFVVAAASKVSHHPKPVFALSRTRIRQQRGRKSKSLAFFATVLAIPVFYVKMHIDKNKLITPYCRLFNCLPYHLGIFGQSVYSIIARQKMLDKILAEIWTTTPYL